jgi:predicted DNA-binding transcriptional regulator AlpA
MPIIELDPAAIYRWEDAEALFGFRRSQLKAKIKDGILPAPKLLLPPPSRNKGWLGADIIAWRAKVAASQAEWNRPGATHYNLPLQPKEPTPAAKPKVAKVKGLKRPVRQSAKG